jgi:nitrate/TMAO reductase-like tetraheme cytochrome c subunit
MKSKSVWLFLGGIVLVLVFLGSFYSSSDSNFCTRCHEMKNDHAAWIKSNHSKVDCVKCHIEPGTINLINRKVNALGEVASHFTSAYKTPINKDSKLSKTMSSGVCTSCHKVPSKTIYGVTKFSHKEHSKTNCAYCHNRVAHSQIKGYLDRTNMAYCMDCHKNKKESINCNTCHPAGITQKPASHLSGNWVSTHEKSVAKYCTACHDTAFCSDCHKNPKKSVPPSHKATDWQKVHKKAAFQGCKDNCHDQTYCDHCHNGFRQMPASHKTGKWMTEHTKQSNSDCAAICHRSSFCANCHSGPQVRPVSHKKIDWTYNSHQFESNPSCVARCHVEEDCNGCHTSSPDQDAGNDKPGVEQ